MAFKMVAEVGFEPTRNFGFLMAYETTELGLATLLRDKLAAPVGLAPNLIGFKGRCITLLPRGG